jgi:hypothetical protein
MLQDILKRSVHTCGLPCTQTHIFTALAAVLLHFLDCVLLCCLNVCGAYVWLQEVD